MHRTRDVIPVSERRDFQQGKGLETPGRISRNFRLAWGGQGETQLGEARAAHGLRIDAADTQLPLHVTFVVPQCAQAPLSDADWCSDDRCKALNMAGQRRILAGGGGAQAQDVAHAQALNSHGRGKEAGEFTPFQRLLAANDGESVATRQQIEALAIAHDGKLMDQQIALVR